jgi:hypothetical protein
MVRFHHVSLTSFATAASMNRRNWFVKALRNKRPPRMVDCGSGRSGRYPLGNYCRSMSPTRSGFLRHALGPCHPLQEECEKDSRSVRADSGRRNLDSSVGILAAVGYDSPSRGECREGIWVRMRCTYMFWRKRTVFITESMFVRNQFPCGT